jgi:hypothetical protein
MKSVSSSGGELPVVYFSLATILDATTDVGCLPLRSDNKKSSTTLPLRNVFRRSLMVNFVRNGRTERSSLTLTRKMKRGSGSAPRREGRREGRRESWKVSIPWIVSVRLFTPLIYFCIANLSGSSETITDVPMSLCFRSRRRGDTIVRPNVQRELGRRRGWLRGPRFGPGG